MWRKRLQDISWFMRYLNENIARRANEEDRCKGRFWEGRYKSQALLDETALLTCMMYVDLNPIRAGINAELESSDYTSIQTRIAEFGEQLKKHKQQQKSTNKKQNLNKKPQFKLTVKQIKRATTKANKPALYAFAGNESAKQKSGIPFGVIDYLELIDWTGREVRDDKTGHIPKHVEPILQKLNINQDNWIDNVSHFESYFYKAIGRAEELKSISGKMKNRHWFKGMSQCHRLYQPPPTNPKPH